MSIKECKGRKYIPLSQFYFDIHTGDQKALIIKCDKCGSDAVLMGNGTVHTCLNCGHKFKYKLKLVQEYKEVK